MSDEFIFITAIFIIAVLTTTAPVIFEFVLILIKKTIDNDKRSKYEKLHDELFNPMNE